MSRKYHAVAIAFAAAMAVGIAPVSATGGGQSTQTQGTGMCGTILDYQISGNWQHLADQPQGSATNIERNYRRTELNLSYHENQTNQHTLCDGDCDYHERDCGGSND